MPDPMGTATGDVWRVVVSGVGIYLAVLVYARVAGLRSFAQISAFDFAMTVAVGSLVASVTVTSSASLADGAIGLATLFAMQTAVALARRKLKLGGLVDNTPRLLIADGRILEDQVAAARLTDDDVRAKLRGAGVHSLADVDALVLETTGDVSVISGGEPIDPELLAGLQGAEALTGAR